MSSRLAQQVAFINSPGKNTATRSVSETAAAKEVVPDLHVLDVGRPGTAPDIRIEAGDVEQELALLRAENAELRMRLEQNEQLMHAAAASEEVWLERQKEHEMLLEEKSDVIRNLHQMIHELQQGSEGQNLARADELDDLKRKLDERQAQLTEDENTLNTQMRTMEMALSRDRAELARQRNDLQRLKAEIDREIEMAGRDAGLRERLASLTRRNNPESAVRKLAPKTELCIELPPLPAAPPAARTPRTARPAAPAPVQAPAPAPAAPKKVGFFRRLFGR